MKKIMMTALLLSTIAVPSLAQAQDAAAEGTFSLATNPPVMVYLDGHRVGMSPLLNQRLPAGEHRLSLLLLRGSDRLQANYLVIVEADRATIASLDLATSAPAEGEVRTLEPEPVVARQAAPAAQPAAPAAAAVERPLPPVEMASLMRNDSQVAVVATPQPLVDESRQAVPVVPSQGLTRDMVRESMEALRPIVERCMAGASGLVQVRLLVQPDGGVEQVEAQGIYADTAIGQCIESALPEEAAFPIYSGDPIPVVYPFQIFAE